MRSGSFTSSTALLSALLVAAGGLAACSSDTSRFGPSPWAAQMARRSAPSSDYTGSIAPAASVSTRALPPLASSPVSAPGSIVVGSGDTLYGIAKRYNVSPSSLMAANAMQDPNTIKLGQRLVIPGASAAASPRFAMTQPARVVAPVQPRVMSHVIAPGDTLFSISRKYNIAPSDLARANNFGPNDKIRAGATLAIPTGPVPATAIAAMQPASNPAFKGADPLTTGSVPKAPPANKFALPPTTKASALVPAPAPLPAHVPLASADLKPPKPVQQASAETTGTLPPAASAADFRWPARGRIISNYGAQSGGGSNDGINIAVPAGTPIRAAENGVVAYAGSELKGYGNLVLVRHEGNLVTAYAHASGINVKRGDRVERGQVIATAGQTGSVNQPQIHFEIRKGSKPVDPMLHLSGM